MVRRVRKVLPKDPEETLALDPDIWRPEEIDILSAGFPCQPFSVAGQQQGESDSRNLWPEVLRTLTYLRPPYAFFENVPGLLANEYFGTILRDLHEAGYDAEWGCFSAQEVGAPHKRERLFILAWHNGQLADSNKRSRIQRKLEEGSGHIVREGGNKYGQLADSSDSAFSRREEEVRGVGSRREEEVRDGRRAEEEMDRGERLGARDSGVVARPHGQISTGQLADSNNEDLEGVRANGHSQGWQEPNGFTGLCSGAIPTWPPSPTDTEGWANVIEQWPCLAPAVENSEFQRDGRRDKRLEERNIQDKARGSSGKQEETESHVCGVAHGPRAFMDRTARLKALGNAVVPQTVAYAFVTLWNRMMEN